jgi:hypothetical protein
LNGFEQSIRDRQNILCRTDAWQNGDEFVAAEAGDRVAETQVRQDKPV